MNKYIKKQKKNIKNNNIETFISSSSAKLKKEKVDEKRVDAFITKFNYILRNGIEDGDESFTANTSLNKIPTLNDVEFELVAIRADEQGWSLTQFEDNYQTITYKMEKKTNENKR